MTLRDRLRLKTRAQHVRALNNYGACCVGVALRLDAISKLQNGLSSGSALSWATVHRKCASSD
jgi:hypothetical protein